MRVGIDLVELARFSDFAQRNQQGLPEVFTAGELAAAEGERRSLYLATRWALKEATLKALGTGWASGVKWTEVEALGGIFAPEVKLSGDASRVAARQGITAANGSAAWSGDCVVAMVLLSGSPEGSAEACAP
jgi:holo-[acyl-carrier protein] synthase